MAVEKWFILVGANLLSENVAAPKQVYTKKVLDVDDFVIHFAMSLI